MIEKAGVLYFRFFCYLYVLFSFVLIQKKKIPKRKNQDCIFYATLFLRFAKEKELATLKQLFLFDATLRSFASRCENEVGMPCGLDAMQA